MLKNTGTLKRTQGLQKGNKQLSRGKSTLKAKFLTNEQKQARIEAIMKMRQLFEEHWRLKDKRHSAGSMSWHQCESCECVITGENKSLYHHHCWPKSSYPEYKYRIDNLLLVCGDCHTGIENSFMTEKTRNKIEEIKNKVV